MSKFIPRWVLFKNKILNFNEFIDDYDFGGQVKQEYKNKDIAFAPNIIAGSGLEYIFRKHTNFTITAKYVGKQYLDNTQNEERKIQAYSYFNFNASHTFYGVKFKSITLGIQINNFLNNLYQANGYTYSYIYGGIKTAENFYYPQAGINFMAFCNLKF